MDESTDFVPQEIFLSHFDVLPVEVSVEVTEPDDPPPKKLKAPEKLCCTFCKKPFRTSKILAMHIEKAHPKIKGWRNMKKYENELKEKTSKAVNVLPNGEVTDKTDSTARNHKCSECDSTFKRKDHMVRHFQSQHTLNSGFPCRICKRMYTRKDHVSRHMREKH